MHNTTNLIPLSSNDLHILAHHGNHEIEQSDSLNESETENGIREQLATHARVASDGHEESCKDHTDTDSGSAKADSSRAHTDVLRNLNHSSGDLRRECAGGLTTHHAAGGGIENVGYLLALHGLEGGSGIGTDALADTYHQS